jgi:Glycosyltransferase family 17
MRRVWDTFPFCNELDLLEARLIELDDAVYRHVLVEAPVTHQGTPKPLWFAENRERFAPWKDKIIHVVADLGEYADGNPADPFKARSRELAQRQAITDGLDGIQDDDIFLVSDVDEIPRPGMLQQAPGHALVMRSHVLAVNLLEPGWWTGSLATSGRTAEIVKAIEMFYYRQVEPTMDALRDDIGWPLIAGAHFTWLGGPSAMRTKARSFMHPEATDVIDQYADHFYRDRVSPASAGQHLIQVVIDESWPRYMQERRGPANWYWPGV